MQEYENVRQTSNYGSGLMGWQREGEGEGVHVGITAGSARGFVQSYLAAAAAAHKVQLVWPYQSAVMCPWHQNGDRLSQK